MKAKSIKGTTPEEIFQKLKISITNEFKPTLAFVFLSIQQDRKSIVEGLNSFGISIFGSTTAGEFIDGDIEENSTVILMLDMDPTHFHIELLELDNNSTLDLSKQIGSNGKSKFDNPSFIICGADSSFQLEKDIIANGIQLGAGKEVIISGGIAGDDGTFTKQFIFTNHKSTEDGIIALILNADLIELKGCAISGWKPAGTVKEVTKSTGPWVQMIDNKPALDQLIKYMGFEIKRGDPENIFTQLGTSYPFQIQKIDMDPIMIPPLMVNWDEQSVMLPIHIPTGTKFRFSLPAEFDIITDVLDNSKKIKEDEMSEADALLIFSCSGRYHALGPMVTEEIKGLCEIWQVPTAGFFCYGEFGSSIHGKPNFHGTTCSWIALKEIE